MYRFEPNMRINRLLAAAAVPWAIGIALLPATLVGQARVSTAPGVSVSGDVPQPMSWTLAELRRLPRTTVTAASGQQTVFEGVLVSKLLEIAGVPLGEALRGRSLTTIVRAIASDDYEVVFSLSELDPAMHANSIIVADTAGGKALAEGQGPLRLVAPDDKRPARSVRMLERLVVTQVRK